MRSISETVKFYKSDLQIKGKNNDDLAENMKLDPHTIDNFHILCASGSRRLFAKHFATFVGHVCRQWLRRGI